MKCALSTSFDAKTYFYAAAFMSREVGKKNQSVTLNAANSTMGVVTVQPVQKNTDVLMNVCLLLLLCVFLKTYELFNLALLHFQVLSL